MNSAAADSTDEGGEGDAGARVSEKGGHTHRRTARWRRPSISGRGSTKGERPHPREGRGCRRRFSFRARNSLLQRTAARGELELSLVVRRIKNAEVAVLRKKIKKFNVVTGLLLAVVTGASPACCRSEGLRWSDRPSCRRPRRRDERHQRRHSRQPVHRGLDRVHVPSVHR